MLFVLTAADFAAVGPGVWNSWKAEVLADLYRRTMRHLAGDAPASDTRRAAASAASRGPQAAWPAKLDEPWFERQIDALPHAYAFSTAAGADRRRAARAAQPVGPATCTPTAAICPRAGTVEFVVGTHESITPGVFHKLTGALASQGLQILSAEINTLADGLVLDRFYVNDPTTPNEPPPERLDEVEPALVAVAQVAAAARRRRFARCGAAAAERDRGALNRLPTRVLIDNSTSDRFTIIDVFAARPAGPAVHDRPHALRAGACRSRWPRSAPTWTRWSTCST